MTSDSSKEAKRTPDKSTVWNKKRVEAKVRTALRMARRSLAVQKPKIPLRTLRQEASKSFSTTKLQ
jgi:hypothetical protein